MAQFYGQGAHRVKVGKPPFAPMGNLPESSVMPKKKNPAPGALPDREQVALHLAAARDALGLSRAEMADSFKCDRSDYIKYEEAERNFPLAKAWALYGRHDFDLNFLYDGKLDGVPSKHREAVIRFLNRPPERKAS